MGAQGLGKHFQVYSSTKYICDLKDRNLNRNIENFDAVGVPFLDWNINLSLEHSKLVRSDKSRLSQISMYIVPSKASLNVKSMKTSNSLKIGKCYPTKIKIAGDCVRNE